MTAPRDLWRIPGTSRTLPWWLLIVAVYILARAVSTVLLLIFAEVQVPNPWTGAQPDYSQYANIWDARWYQIVAYHGYPAELPLTPDGHVTENAWAFLPGYPFLVRGISVLTQLPWEISAIVVSVLAGLGAALVFYRLLIRFLDRSQAMFAVVLLCVAPVSPILQVGYAESLFLLLLATALLFLVQRRYLLLLPVVAGLAFTRPGVLAFALTLVLHIGYRFWVSRYSRPPQRFPPREVVLTVIVAAWSAALGFAWPLIAGVVTGNLAAYTETELSWRSGYIGYGELLPFTPWFQGGNWWLGIPLGAVVVFLLVVAFAVMLFTPYLRRLGLDIRFWLASYGLYLLAVFFPQSSTFRILAPMFPLLGALAIPRSRVYRITLVVVCVAFQAFWIAGLWYVRENDWTPP